MNLFMINQSSGAYAYLHCIKKCRNWCYAQVSAGFSSGNAGGNTRLSPRGKLQLNLQVANPTPLSNEAMAVGKNDESFGGESKFSIDFFFHYKIITVS